MSETKRDTQFAGFAKALSEELLNEIGYAVSYFDADCQSNLELIIARRAYDLVSHTIAHVDTKDLDMLEEQECVERIPDMRELPKEEEEQAFRLSEELSELLNHDEGTNQVAYQVTNPIEPVREGFFRMNVRDFGPHGPRTINIITADHKLYHGTVHYKEDEENVYIERDVYPIDKGEDE